jgi:hypothetical protein
MKEAQMKEAQMKQDKMRTSDAWDQGRTRADYRPEPSNVPVPYSRWDS